MNSKMFSTFLLFILNLVLAVLIFLIVVFYNPKIVSNYQNTNYNQRNNTLILSDLSDESRQMQQMLNIEGSVITFSKKIREQDILKYDTVVFIGHGNGKISCGIPLDWLPEETKVELFTCSSEEQPKLNIIRGNKSKDKYTFFEFLFDLF